MPLVLSNDNVVFFTPEKKYSFFRRLRCARTSAAKINFPLGTIKFILLYLILARQTDSHQTATSIYRLLSTEKKNKKNPNENPLM